MLMYERDGEKDGGSGSEHCRVLGAYGWDTYDGNDERLLAFAFSHDLALANTFSRAPKNGIFQRGGK